MLTGRWRLTAATGLIALVAAFVLLGVSGGESVVEHAVFAAALTAVAVVNVITAAVIERSVRQ